MIGYMLLAIKSELHQNFTYFLMQLAQGTVLRQTPRRMMLERGVSRIGQKTPVDLQIGKIQVRLMHQPISLCRGGSPSLQRPP